MGFELSTMTEGDFQVALLSVGRKLSEYSVTRRETVVVIISIHQYLVLIPFWAYRILQLLAQMTCDYFKPKKDEQQ